MFDRSLVQERYEKLMNEEYYPLRLYWLNILDRYTNEFNTSFTLITPYGTLRSVSETKDSDTFLRKNPLREWVRNVRSRIFVEGNIIACEPINLQDDDDVQKARVAEEFLQELIKTKKLDLEEVIRLALLYFSSFVVIYPDAIPSAELVVHPAYNVAIDVDGLSYIVAHPLSITKALLLFPSLRHYEDILEAHASSIEIVPAKMYADDYVLLYEYYYFKPKSNAWVREVYLHDFPTMLDRRIFKVKPIHQFKVEASHTPYGTSPVMEVFPVGEIESVYFSKLAEYIKRMPLGIVYVPASTANINNIQGEAMDGSAILELKVSGLDNTKPIETWTSPLLDTNKLMGWQLVQSWTNNAAGLSDVTLRSQVPRRAYTFSSLQFLYEQDLSRMASIKTNLEKTLIELSYSLLYFADKFTFLDEALNKKILANIPLTVKVKAIMENGIPENRMIKQRLVMELIQMGIAQFLSPLERRKLLVALEFPSINKVLQVEPTEETLIQKENIMLESGQQVPVLPFENHAMHIEGHQRYLSKHKIEWLGDEEKIKNFVNHIMQHMAILQQFQGGASNEQEKEKQ